MPCSAASSAASVSSSESSASAAPVAVPPLWPAESAAGSAASVAPRGGVANKAPPRAAASAGNSLLKARCALSSAERKSRLPSGGALQAAFDGSSACGTCQ